MINPKIGFMQGRLTELVDQKIQSFPIKNWEKEFQYSSEIGINLMEWTLDQNGLYQNPLMTSNGRKKINELMNKFNLKIPSLTGDCFMQEPFWKKSGIYQSNLQKDFINICNSCSDIGIEFIVVPLVDNGSITSAQEEKDLLNFMNKKINLFQKLNIKILFELDFSPQKALHFIKKLDENIFGINYDMGNSASLGFSAKEEIKLYGSRIMNVHVKDRLLGGTTVTLGDGNVDFNSVFSNLSKSN